MGKKTENLKAAYAAIKAGHTIDCNGCKIYIYTVDWDFHKCDYGKSYIGWEHYGSSAERLGINHLRWIMNVVAKSPDYSFTII